MSAKSPPVPEVPENVENKLTIDIKHDIWFHIALQLDPEDVQTFALVCKQFARLVNSRAFWRHIYKRYCLSVLIGAKTGKRATDWYKEQICDKHTLRFHVIEMLFHCYRPLKERMELGYSLDWLLQRTFVSCSQKQYHCMWIICYTLWNQVSSVKITEAPDADTEVVNDWEALADDDDVASGSSYNPPNPHEGIILLVVLSRQFIPLPLQLLYNPQQTRFRLKATRELLCADMRAKDLELEFDELNNSQSQMSITVKYPNIEKYRVLPWWHPEFKRFLK